MKNILIVTPDLKKVGGVSNHYLGLNNYWTTLVKYAFYGKRSNSLLPAIVLLPFDFLKFIVLIIFKKIDVIIVNPSFRRYQIIRDGVYIYAAYLLRKKVITFFHGWDHSYAKKIIKKPKLFKKIYNQSIFSYTLSGKFKADLEEIGISHPILLTTTKVNDKLIETFDINRKNSEVKKILYLARVEISKGIIETIDAFEIVKQKHPYVELSIAGEGQMLNSARKYVNENNIKDVTFHGLLKGDEVIAEFSSSDIYILPSREEGMPTSVLEAMAFGLSVITRPVGGLIDFFKDGEMGFFIESYNPQDYADKIIELIKNPQLHKNISINNHTYAINRFLASKVAKQIENDINKYTK